MENFKDFQPDLEFKKSLKKNLSDNGLLLTNDELDVIIKTFLKTLVVDYIFKFKKVVFNRFGTFEGLILKMKSPMYGDGESFSYPKFKFTPSLILKDEFKRRYKTLTEESDRKG